ncbi:hypothetical protein Q9R19_12700 [Microbacterium sp. ARD32]|uniref:hypothetical protein n=1 Tax=Microbacterium sp. ARD32 TaxID=2962577 RepID=UPI00288114E4|nr:hypothetical protein [Microbacterium sp. ARD32]MDT0158485.1 hypothetical protein [Microbacterium sp. ARD32]
MTAPDTLPLRIPLPIRMHEHAWLTESAHATSEGEIVYVRCVGCAARRVDLRMHEALPPVPQSHVATAAS